MGERKLCISKTGGRLIAISLLNREVSS